MLHDIYINTPYEFNALALQTLVVALGVATLGIFALIREQGSHVSVVYFILSLSIGVWLFGFSWMYSAIEVNLAMWWGKVAYVGIAFIPAAVYNFSALILQDYDKVRKRVLVVWVVSAVFISLIITTDIQFSSLYRYPWGFYPKSNITSIPFIVFFLVVMIVALRGIWTAFHRATRGSLQYLRARTLLLAFGFGYIGALDFIISFGVSWYPIGYAAILVFTLISTWSILRYQFMAITPAFAAGQIIDTMKDALIVFDPDGVVRLVNQATCSRFACREADLVGKRLSLGMAGDAAFAEQLESIIRSGTVQDREVGYRRQQNHLRTLSISTSIMRNRIGEPLATVCMASDVTERKSAEEERERLIGQLQEANRKLQAVDKMKSDFVSVVSHELRTPLTTIKAFIELILMKPDMPDQQKTKLMATINAETDRLSRLISDLLDLARIEAGSLQKRSDEVSIEDIVKNALTAMGPIFANKGLRVTTAFDASPGTFSGDRDRMLQVVTNVLSNAVKFTPQGGAIHVAVRREELPLPQIAVEISDTGLGIAAADLDLIFEKFHRSTDQQAGSIEGTGLGLAIARQIVEYHGGRIWAASVQGKGSTFTFTLPLGAGNGQQAEARQ
jgi:PAS domain S-box-containing protein